jgi:hypothetical protein
MADFDNDFAADGCDCPACRPELYPAEPMDVPFAVPEGDTYNKELADEDSEVLGATDGDIDRMLDDIFADFGGKVIKIDGPADLDAIFAQIFGNDETLSDEEVARRYPYGPVNFTLDEVKMISSALRVKGTSLAQDALNILNDDAFIEGLSDKGEAFLNELLTAAADESVKCLNLYDWFDDQFDVRQ